MDIILDKSISRNEAKARVIQYSKEHKVDKSVIMAVAGAANVKLDYNALAQRGDVDMCTLFEEERLEGKLEGEAKGIIEAGFDFGLSEHDILSRLQNKLNISLKAAQEYLFIFGKQTV